MKIGIDCRLWNEGGVGRYTRNLVKNLQIIDKENDYILFVLQKDHREIKSIILSQKFKLVTADIMWHSVAEQFDLSNLIYKEKLDLMHFTYVSVPVGFKKPFVVTIHDLIPFDYPTSRASTLPLPFYFLKYWGYKFVVKNAVKKSKKIITPSNFSKEEIAKHFPKIKNKIEVVFEGVDKNFEKKPSSINNSKLNKNYFLYVGNAFPHKNLENLLKAFSELESDKYLVFVGKDDFFYKRLKKNVEKIGLSNKVIFLHDLNDQEVEGLYINALAFVSPTLIEGFGLPVLEAMANKCLVLASDIPVYKELVGDSAIYFNPKNIEDIRKKLDSIHYNDIYHYSEKIKVGFETSKKFSFEKMAKETLKIYESCVSL